jgi:C4-type Zn-finger protein
MVHEKMELDENSLKLIKKCEDKEVASEGMGACQVLLEEMDRGNVVLEDETGQSYIKKTKEKSEGVTQEDVSNVVRIAFIVRDSDYITNKDVKTAANRLIRRIELI